MNIGLEPLWPASSIHVDFVVSRAASGRGLRSYPCPNRRRVMSPRSGARPARSLRPNPSRSGLDDLDAHLAKLARMARAQYGLAYHRVAGLVGTRGLDLHSDNTRSRPVMIQITPEPA